ncbi:protein rolling stone-like [Actinia tenebrosa]|uniref:Protein rolling stone-like n=1 Tax=Actinia tenebrosa TaxID=6105 RepID=A0A6P8J555_ACTTE|nr:protein rolling stone-like [Actinia tenebrosa]
MCLKLSDVNPKKLYPRYPFVRAFTTSPCLPTYAFVLYRLIVGLYCLAWLIFSGYNYNSKWLLYISNWIFVFIAAHFIFGSILSMSYGLSDEAQYYDTSTRWGSEPFIEGFSGYDEDKESTGKEVWVDEKIEDKLGLCHKLLWIIFTIASVGALQITLIYWSIFYEDQEINGVNITFLIFNSVFITIELLLSNLPVVLLHFFYSHIVQSIYILFTVLYWAFGGTDAKGHPYIYKALDYENEPDWAVIFAFLYVVIFQILAHIYCFSLFHLRKWLVRKFYLKL